MSTLLSKLDSGAEVTVLVTGAAGQIAYSLLPLIATGGLLGPLRVRLHLFDVAASLPKLAGVVMELEDLASPLLASVLATADEAAAYAGVDVALLLGAKPRGPGEERSALLAANAPRAASLCLYWGAELSALSAHAPFDAVVACDLVFIALRDGRARELDRTLRRLATELAPVLLVYEERRIADEDAFVRALALPGGDGAPPLRCDEVEDPELVRLPKDERLVGLGGHDEGELEGLFYMPPPVRVVVLRAQ